MSKLQDELDISLLHRDQNAFILQCQNIVRIFVKKFIASGMFIKTDEEDIVQSINERLITKLPSIKALYNGKSLLQTYVGTIIQNICLDLYRQENHRIESVPIAEEKQLLITDPTMEMYLLDELERFSTIMAMFGPDVNKILLCLKIYYRIVITEEEIEQCFPVIFKKYKRSLLVFTEPYDSMSMEESFELLATVFNRHENKMSHWDSLRRWTKKKGETIISLLNGTPPVHAHNMESLKILIEEYTQPSRNLNNLSNQ